ncbi:MAG: hypothetical protein FLDDKLPJ_01023 [Phycisphaerae bacterium]|nr:hypothetical protein [Phycisphaerae bacterium]
MPVARFTPHLHRYFPTLPREGLRVEGTTVREVLTKIEERFEGISDYIVDEAGAVRKHVNVFVGTELIRDRAALSDPVSDASEVYFFQALSGG